MNTSTYLEMLKQSFDFLFTRYGYQIAQHVDSESFGNKYTLLESNQLVLAVIKDREIISLDVRENDGKKVPMEKHYQFFYDFRVILKALNAPEEQELRLLQIDDETQLAAIAKTLQSYYPRILDLFRPDAIEETKKKFNRLQKETASEALR